MSAFSATDFKAGEYEQFRPRYEDSLFEAIVKYHEGDDQLAVDIGCGPGQATYSLTKYFKQVIGTDISQTMIDTANKQISDEFKGKIEFVQSAAEDLRFIEDSSVDVVTAAECVHWFDHPKFFNEVNRILKPNGTLAFWAYGDQLFNISKVDKSLIQFVYEDPTKLGPYWQQPGRHILRTLLKDVEPPSNKFKDLEVYEHIPGKEEMRPSPFKIERDITLEVYGHYIKTWSAYHDWKKQHPDEPDIVDEYLKEIQRENNWTSETVVHLEWLTVLKMSRKK